MDCFASLAMTSKRAFAPSATTIQERSSRAREHNGRVRGAARQETALLWLVDRVEQCPLSERQR